MLGCGPSLAFEAGADAAARHAAPTAAAHADLAAAWAAMVGRRSSVVDAVESKVGGQQSAGATASATSIG